MGKVLFLRETLLQMLCVGTDNMDPRREQEMYSVFAFFRSLFMPLPSAFSLSKPAHVVHTYERTGCVRR